MKKLGLLLLFPAILLIAALTQHSTAQSPSGNAAKWEYGILKWDGPDRIFYNLPGRFEMVHLRDKGIDAPKNAQEEEFYLAYAANEAAAQGWEVVTLDSRRLLVRRPKAN
jgi:hypothetical protein